PPMMAGVITTYAKNFNEASGLGPLPSSYENFPNDEFKIAHEKVIEARNKLYAHRDTDNHSYTSKNEINNAYTVQVSLNESNDAFQFMPILIDIHPDKLSKIKDLILFQIERLKEDLNKKLSVTVDFKKSYSRGVTYTLGVDFP
ncbi:MAG: hypothetical protein OEL79_04485, partial [Chromatiales bacterium]|nr:hypothetical protein [Chromatiales bacterium]